MSLFGKLVRTTINVGIGLPVAIVKDVVTCGGRAVVTQDGLWTTEQLQKIKDEAED